MGLSDISRTGANTEVSSDNAFGLRLQDALSVLHSAGGLTATDGGTAFGVPFHLLAYVTHDTTYATQTTTVTFASDDMPFKLRVLGIKVRCLANRPENFREGYGSIEVVVQDGDGDSTWTQILTVDNVGDMVPGDVREIAVVDHANAVIEVDEGLRVQVKSQADSVGANPTVGFVVECQCLRVI